MHDSCALIQRNKIPGDKPEILASSRALLYQSAKPDSLSTAKDEFPTAI